MNKKKPVKFFNLEKAIIQDMDPYQKFLKKIIEIENLPIEELRIIFVDKNYLRKLHKKYLNDPSDTDVMTFDLSDKKNLEGEIYINPKQAQENANFYSVSLQEEIARLIIHGLLHLRGFRDHTPSEREKMRELENKYINNYWNSL
jgi:probable rRNA maturation factor